ncbi:nucleic acid-binding protein [Polyplosphaeria fusca]|uniref:rRNA biogenesis protein RRP5 n=1 Tax=Polyplosphaeria fusca TaxID=682080 RepID=A0A9P4V1U9_9PLEO|nr:nucleic acid-binding protein [Polyplosphaeria fusca]
MPGPKRKADAEQPSSKRDKSAPDHRSAKRRRQSDATADAAKPPKSSIAKPEKSAQASIFKDEEKAFPRGGASALTPLEHKQIQIKATQDVLFEQSGQKRNGDDGLSDIGSDAGVEDTPKAGKKRKSKKGKKPDAAKEDEQRIKVEGISYKKLLPGTMVLGQVVQVTTAELVLSLPNNLTGIVPLTAISDQLSSRVEKLLEDGVDGDADNEDKELEDVDLEAMFSTGQYLRCCIVSTGEDAPAHGASKAKRRVEVSINPNIVNRGITKSNITVHCMLQASVVSNEDHGLIMDLGLDEPNVRGFLGKSELGFGVDHATIQEGAVFMCLVTGLNSDRRIVKLSTNQQKLGNLKRLSCVTEAPTVDVFLPGTAVDVVVADSSPTTITGTIMGMMNATADVVHSGTTQGVTDMSEKHKIGAKVKGRIIFTFPNADPKKVGISLLDHVLSLSPRMSGKAKDHKDPLEALPISSTVEEAKVTRVEPVTGLYLDLGVRGVIGFAHISRLTDGKPIVQLETSSGSFQVDSKHKARVIGYSAFDGSYQVSLEQKVLDQPFLRIQDIKIGQVVKGKVQKIVHGKTGTGVLVNLADGLTGLVPEMHMADIHLQHPERKFREGASVKGRVLSTDVEDGRIRLTLKKTLVSSDSDPWIDYSTITEGATGPGTIISVKKTGAVVQFFGNVKAFLPASEMSAAFIDDATRYFQEGQVVNVRVISVHAEAERMLVSCKDPNAVGPETDAAFQSLKTGDVVQGTVIQKSADDITVDLGNGIKGVLRLGQLTDGSEKKDKSTMSRVRVGGPLEDVIILDKHYKSRTVTLSNKPSLRKAAQARSLIARFEDVKMGDTVHGFVRGILSDKIFVEFAGRIAGLLFQSRLPDDMQTAPNFGLRKDQSITVRITHVDPNQNRFWLSMRPGEEAQATKAASNEGIGEAVINAVNENLKSTTDLAFGATTSARIRSIKDTQLNVQLADNVQGRISIAELFDQWDDINDKKHPLRQFKANDTLSVTVLGMHDARNHRFLPITHRQGRVPIYELTAKKKKLESQSDVQSLAEITPDSSFIAFINNIAERYVWVNISANVRGRIDLFDLSDDLTLLANVEQHFPVGSALKVRVKTIDAGAGRLDLTATSALSAKSLSLEDLTAGLILPARITKIHESSVVVQINKDIAGPVYLEQLADDYDKSKPTEFSVGEIVRVCIVEVDVSNKRITLSARPSRVLSSSLPVKDVEIQSRSQLKLNQVLRGFVRRVLDTGLLIRLGSSVDAFVRIAHLSDEFIKEWKPVFQIDQLVTGKIIDLKQDSKHPQMSLKKSVIEGKYVPKLQFGDVAAGQIVTAKVRHVEDYGAFLVVDDSENVSGLCHKSEMADKPVEDVKALYKVGDVVKAKVLKVNSAKRKISFGLKYSYFQDQNDEEDDDMDDVDGEAEPDNESSGPGEITDDEDAEMRSVHSEGIDEDVDMEDEVVEGGELGASKTLSGPGLSTSGFDWTGTTLDLDQTAATAPSSDEDEPRKKKKHKKATIKEDRTGDLDAYGPQSVADYERLLLGQPNSAELWVRYMVFQRELSEIDKARQIARRALSTMNPREEKERLDVWTALLHLESDFASDEAIEEMFREACQNNDSREMHERMIKIYISSGKLDKADILYQSMTKNKAFTVTPSLWLSYATFLMSALQPPSPSRARALLPRATQSVPESEHRYLTTKFAALEFKTPNGDPERGRTIFEGLVSTWPKKGDLWDVYLSLELSHGSEENARSVFERMSKLKMKRKRAAGVFGRWKEWEEKVGNQKGVARVGEMERDWVEKKEGGEDAE